MPRNKQYIIRLKEGKSLKAISDFRQINSCRPLYDFNDDPFKETQIESYKFDDEQINAIQNKDFYQKQLDKQEQEFYRTYIINTKRYSKQEHFFKKLDEIGIVDYLVEDEKIELFDFPNLNTEQIISYGLDKVKCFEGWDIIGNKGEGVIIALIDSGVTPSHPDLVNRLIKINDNFNINLSGDGKDNDLNGHGTHIAGIIGANNNNLGVCGIAPMSKIISIKAFPESFDHTFDSTCASAIFQAVKLGAKVINCSWGRKGETTEVIKAIKFAISQNVCIVCAAGNSIDDFSLISPANMETVIAVGASDKFDGKYLDSNFGKNLIYAPGVEILSTYTNSENPPYKSLSGTSFSAPYIVGLCALILSFKPDLTPNQIKDIILNPNSFDTMTDIETSEGLGRINFSKCLNMVKNQFTTST